MINYGCMGVYINLKSCVGVYNFLATLIMVNFSVMGGILVLKTSLKFYSSLDISTMINFCSMSNYGPFSCCGWFLIPKTHIMRLQFCRHFHYDTF
jgi:hypothetical protein